MGTSNYGGAFLLIPGVLRLYRIAQRVFKNTQLKQGAERLILSLYFKGMLGIERIFHFETLDDVGFAILTGGKKVMSRSRLGQMLRHVSTLSVKKLMRTSAPRLSQADQHTVSIDEHAVARFTRKFAIPKGFHTIRNKKMKVEKLTYVFDIASRQLLSLVVSTGKAKLSALTKQLLPAVRRKARGAPLRVILDAGAAHNHDELLDVALRDNQVTTVRAPRRTAYRQKWKQLPPEAWTERLEPGPYTDAPAKAIAIAETTTVIRGKRHREGYCVRTIVIRESMKKGKQRWHALWIFGDEHTEPYDVVNEFRARQHHEQTYRVMLHDVHVDTAPSGYNKRSREPARPGFQQGALSLYGWIAALVTNALLEFSQTLPERFHRAHPRTLRRWFLFTPADLYLGTDTLIVSLRPKRLRGLWQALIAQANRRHTRIPWMDNRRLILSLEPSQPPRLRKSQLIQPREP